MAVSFGARRRFHLSAALFVVGGPLLYRLTVPPRARRVPAAELLGTDLQTARWAVNHWQSVTFPLLAPQPFSATSVPKTQSGPKRMGAPVRFLKRSRPL